MVHFWTKISDIGRKNWHGICYILGYHKSIKQNKKKKIKGGHYHGI